MEGRVETEEEAKGGEKVGEDIYTLPHALDSFPSSLTFTFLHGWNLRTVQLLAISDQVSIEQKVEH
jgi:hypothetical protein